MVWTSVRQRGLLSANLLNKFWRKNHVWWFQGPHRFNQYWSKNNHLKEKKKKELEHKCLQKITQRGFCSRNITTKCHAFIHSYWKLHIIFNMLYLVKNAKGTLCTNTVCEFKREIWFFFLFRASCAIHKLRPKWGHVF